MLEPVSEDSSQAPPLAPGVLASPSDALRDEEQQEEASQTGGAGPLVGGTVSLPQRPRADSASIDRRNSRKPNGSFTKRLRSGSDVQVTLSKQDLDTLVKLQRWVRKTRRRRTYRHGKRPLNNNSVLELMDEAQKDRRHLSCSDFDVPVKGQLLNDIATHSLAAVGSSLESMQSKNRVNVMRLMETGIYRLFEVMRIVQELGNNMVHPAQLLSRIEKAVGEIIPECSASMFEVVGGQSLEAKKRDKSSGGTLVNIHRRVKIDARAMPCTGEAIVKTKQAIWHDTAAHCPGLVYADVWRSEESTHHMGFFFDDASESLVSQQLSQQGFQFRVDHSRSHLASSMIATPMLDEVGVPAAVLLAHHRKGKSFSRDDALLLELFCGVAGEIHRTASSLSRAMNSNHKLSKTLQDVRLNCVGLKDTQSVAKRLVPADDCLVLTWSGAEQNELRPLIDSGISNRFFEGMQTELGKGFMRVLTSSELQLMQQEQKDAWLQLLQQLPTPVTPSSEWRSLMILPLIKPGDSYFKNKEQGSTSSGRDDEPERPGRSASRRQAARARSEAALPPRTKQSVSFGIPTLPFDKSSKKASLNAEETERENERPTRRGTARRRTTFKHTAWRDTAREVAGPEGKRLSTATSGEDTAGVSLGKRGLEGAMIWINRCKERYQFDVEDEVEAERFGQLTMTSVTWIYEKGRSDLMKSGLSNALKQKRALVETAKLLAGNLDLLGLFSSIMSHAKGLMEVDRSTLFLYDKENHELWSKVADGAAPIRVPADSGIAGAVCMTKTVLNIGDAYADPRFNKDIDKQTGYRTKNILAVPILSPAGEMLGVLQLINKVTALNFSQEDVMLAEAFTFQIAICVANCLTYEHLAVQHDILTRHIKQIKTALDVAKELTQQVEFKPLCLAFNKCASRLVQASAAEVFVVDGEQGQITQQAAAFGLQAKTYSILMLCRENRTNLVSVAARCAMMAADGDQPLLLKGPPLASADGCILLLPLRSGRTAKLVGVLAVTRENGHFSGEQTRWLFSLAEAGAVGLESIESYEQLDLKLRDTVLNSRRYQALLRVDRAISASRGSSLAMDVFSLTRMLLPSLDATHCSFFVIDWRQGTMRSGKSTPIAIEHGLLSLVARTGKAINLEDATIHVDYDAAVDGTVSRGGVRHPSLLLVPVVGSHGHVLGILQAVGKKNSEPVPSKELLQKDLQKKEAQKDAQKNSHGREASRARTFSRHDQDFLEQFGTQIAVMLEYEALANDRSLISLSGDFRANDDLMPVGRCTPRVKASPAAATARPQTSTPSSIRTPQAATTRSAAVIEQIQGEMGRSQGPRVAVGLAEAPPRPSTSTMRRPQSPRAAALSRPTSSRSNRDSRPRNDGTLPDLPMDMAWPTFGDRSSPRRPASSRGPPAGLARAALPPREPVSAHTISLPRPAASEVWEHQRASARVASQLAEQKRPESVGKARSKRKAGDASARRKLPEFVDVTEEVWEDVFSTVRRLTAMPTSPR